MSLEQALQENTAALVRVAELLEVSNAERAKLLASAGNAAPSGGSSITSDDGLTVADIKEQVKSADLDTLNSMLAAEKDGKNRSSAVKAIEDAIAAKGNGAGPDVAATPTPTETPTPAPAEQTGQAASPSDKNSQPVPAGVTAEQAAQAFGAWFGETDDEAERAKRRAFVEGIVGKLGSKISELDGEKARQAVFYLRRKRAGLGVDFDAAFDFNGSPTQEVTAVETAAAADDDLL